MACCLWLAALSRARALSKAQADGYRSRAAYKLMEIDEKLGFLKPGAVILDLGAAPGGWCQVAAKKGCRVVALDLLEIDALPNVTFFKMDFMDDAAPDMLRAALGGGADAVLSDMAPNTTGHRNTDHIRIMALAEAAYDFAAQVLNPGGTFLAKVLQGGAEKELLLHLKQNFETVKHVKPPASRKDSAETYVVATGFKGMGASSL